MLDLLQNRSIGFKILTGILLVITIGAGSSLFGLFSIGRIGIGLNTVTRDNLPLLNRMAGINQKQLEQSLLFERGLQLALIISSTEDGYQRVSELKNAYAGHGKEIGTSMQEFIGVSAKVARESAGKGQTVYNDFAETMRKMHADYLASQKQAEEIFNYMLQGRIDDAGTRVEQAQGASEVMRDRLADMQKQLVTMTNVAAEESHVQETAAYATMSMLMIVSVLAGLLFAWLITRGITVPLRDTLKALEDIAEGEGDLTKRIEVEGRDELAMLGNAFNRFADKIHRVLANVANTAEFVVEGSRGISSSNNNLLSRTDDQRARLSESSSSMEEMTGTLKQNAASTSEAKKLAEANHDRAMAGAEVVMQAVDAVSDINASSDRIADIIGTIDGIAFQTNLLALNAAVEAARAGEQGRGFAVVASEVRSLAQRSAEAAKEIKTLIEDSLNKVRSGTRLVDESGKALEEIIVGTKRVADLIADIAELGQEQAIGIELVSSSITHMDRMTDENAEMVRETAAASRTMLDQVEGLMQQIGFFKLGEGSLTLDAPDGSGSSGHITYQQ